MTPSARISEDDDHVDPFWGHGDEQVYEHVFPYAGAWWSFKRGRPVRYLDIGSDMSTTHDGLIEPIEYRTREEAEADNGELFHAGYYFFEFYPDHDLGLLVGHTPTVGPSPLWPHDAGTPFATRFHIQDDAFETLEWPPLVSTWNGQKIDQPEGT
jgi:hypothetical protein